MGTLRMLMAGGNEGGIEEGSGRVSEGYLIVAVAIIVR